MVIVAGQDTAHTQILDLTLDGDPAGRQVLHLAAEDADHDGYADLVVQPGEGPAFVFLTDTGTQELRPPTAEELRRITAR